MFQSAEIITGSLELNGTGIALSSFSEDSGLRIIVTDPSLQVRADTSSDDNTIGHMLLLPGINAALSGEKHYYAYAEDGAFVYNTLSSFTENGETCVLYMRYTDEGAAEYFHRSRTICTLLGIALALPPFLLYIYQIVSFSSRLNHLRSSIEHLTSGKYASDMSLSGHDELAYTTQLLDNFSKRQSKTDELRRRFVSDASHELKTPLAAVKLLSDSILLTPTISYEDTREFLTDISNEIDRLTRICTRLLQITKFDAFSEDAELVRLDLAPVAENVCRMLSRSASNAGLELRCELQDNCFVLANYDLVYQVFYNLIENAVKYGVDGKEVRVFLYRKEDSVVFIVDDDGIGIPESDLSRIFDRFYRVDKARARATGGTGLGLSIVATAVHTCRGTVEAQNRKPCGARFIVTFPFCRDSSDSERWYES